MMKNLKTKNGAESVLWDLKELFSSIDDPQISYILRNTTKKADNFAKNYKGNLAKLKPADLKKAFIDNEKLISPLYKLSQYANLIYSTDTANDRYKALLDKVDEVQSFVGNKILFFSLELGKLPKDKLESFEIAKELKAYKYMIRKIRKNAKYKLSEKEEQLANLKDLTGAVGHKKLYEELTSSFMFEFETDKKIKKMNGSELRALRHNPNPDIRRRAMKMFFDKYKENEIVITHLFNAILKDYNIEKDLRGYKSSIGVMNTHNDLDDKVIELLHDITTESNKLVHKYYKIKAKLLNLPDMSLADIYAPMPQSKKKYTWYETKNLVLDGFAKFDDHFHKMAKKMFDDKRIHAPVHMTKRGGAYCSSSTPGLDPFVLVNFLGKERDVSTLAHELGHAIHAMFSAEQPLANYHSILPLAETASVFSEMLLLDMILAAKTDKSAKIAILTSKLEDTFATSHRQNMFSSFEKQAHEGISQNRMSGKELCELYFKELKLMFGNSVKYPEEYAWEWSSIPHMFEVPFYVYSYNFGNLLVMGLYESYLEQGKSFIPGYKKFLSMGSSASPKEIAKSVGVDILSEKFWQKSIVYIEKQIMELEKLI